MTRTLDFAFLCTPDPDSDPPVEPPDDAVPGLCEPTLAMPCVCVPSDGDTSLDLREDALAAVANMQARRDRAERRR